MPAKLFISYPSESWNFAQRIAEKLVNRVEQSIFIDYRSIDQADFAASILKHLRESDAVLLMVTEYTFEDIHRDKDWVRLEIRTALECEIPIVLVRENGLLPPSDLPDDVRGVSRSQGIPFYREFFDPGIDLLTEFLMKIRVATPRVSSVPGKVIAPTPPPASPKQEPEPQRVINASSLDEAADLLEVGEFERALVILETMKKQGGLPSFSARMVDEMIPKAMALQQAEQQRREAQVQAEQRRREAELDYAPIVAFAKRTVTEASARAAFAEWCSTYPEWIAELDTHNLRVRFPASRSAALLPAPFAWVPIPGKGYSIAKYPLTNAQYKLFMDAGGYQQSKWWTKAGWKQRESDKWTEPRYWKDANWNGAEQPVVGVSWYEAVAFCLWLSEASGEKIMLPTEDQWQYAAQGDDGRAFPWGNDWDGARCNNSVKPFDSNQTTPVRQYEGKDKGDSPFGAVDMAGNVWEWCLTDFEAKTNDVNSNANIRVLRGGSWYNDHSDFFRCDYRNSNSPHYWDNNRGVRLALS